MLFRLLHSPAPALPIVFALAFLATARFCGAL